MQVSSDADHELSTAMQALQELTTACIFNAES
jgi:hypothetical protein